MDVTLLSVDNPHLIKRGGKHIHQLLLERGLREIGVNVHPIYPAIKYDPLPRRYFKYLLSTLLKRDLLAPYQVRINHVLDSLLRTYALRSNEIRASDVLHFHDVVSLYAFIRSGIAIGSLPVVLTIHGYFSREFVDYNFVLKFLEKKLYLMLIDMEKRAVSTADLIIAADSRIKGYLVRTFGYPEEKIVVIPNAVDTSMFTPPTEDEIRSIRKTLGFSMEEFIVLVPRRLVPKNGVIYSVRAMGEIPQKYNIKLVIAGDGVERAKIKREIERLGLQESVVMLGSVPHERIVRYFKISDAVLIPSVTSHGVQEATSLAALEAMSCGKPVIVTNVGGLKEIVDNYENGIIVPERDAKAIADALIKLYEHPDMAKSLGRKAREYVIEHHSYLSYSKRVLEIYERAIALSKYSALDKT